MKYFKGDIVEIITAKYKSWNDIPSHERSYYEHQKRPAPFIGQRFRVHKDSEDNKVYAWIDNNVCLMTSIDCIRLVKRPFKNHILNIVYMDTMQGKIDRSLKKITR